MERNETTYPPDYVMAAHNEAERERAYEAARPRARAVLYMPGFAEAPGVSEPSTPEPVSAERGVTTMRM